MLLNAINERPKSSSLDYCDRGGQCDDNRCPHAHSMIELDVWSTEEKIEQLDLPGKIADVFVYYFCEKETVFSIICKAEITFPQATRERCGCKRRKLLYRILVRLWWPPRRLNNKPSSFPSICYLCAARATLNGLRDFLWRTRRRRNAKKDTLGLSQLMSATRTRSARPKTCAVNSTTSATRCRTAYALKEPSAPSLTVRPNATSGFGCARIKVSSKAGAKA